MSVAHEERIRVPTGVTNFDKRISGGLIRGKTYLIAGETGTGKTIFSLKFLLTGAQDGEPGLYIPFDETIDSTIEGALTLGWDLMDPIKKGLIEILDVRPFFAEVTREKFMAETVKEVINELKKHVSRIKAKRLVVDPVAPLLGEVVDISWTRDYIRALVSAIERFLGTTTLITSEIPTASNALSRFGVEEFLASGIIRLSIEKIDFMNVRTITVRKMRWTKVDLMPYVYEIKPGEGIIVGDPLPSYMNKVRKLYLDESLRFNNQ
ncbi:MAG: ATPase domain-containing protein [Thermoproteota archaeon]